MLVPLGLQAVVQPAFDYRAIELDREDPEALRRLEDAGPGDLAVFTSPRAVSHGLPQLPREALLRCRVAAIGPATESALKRYGLEPALRGQGGYTSEALLQALRRQPPLAGGHPEQAFIFAAPGGREVLSEGLAALGWRTQMVMVYRPLPAELDRAALDDLADASGTLAVWTSGNAMKALAQRLPTPAWLRLCKGEWLVISDRLQRLARAYGPMPVHLASGPGNAAILAAVRGLVGRAGPG